MVTFRRSGYSNILLALACFRQGLGLNIFMWIKHFLQRCLNQKFISQKIVGGAERAKTEPVSSWHHRHLVGEPKKVFLQNFAILTARTTSSDVMKVTNWNSAWVLLRFWIWVYVCVGVLVGGWVCLVRVDWDVSVLVCSIRSCNILFLCLFEWKSDFNRH